MGDKWRSVRCLIMVLLMMLKFEFDIEILLKSLSSPTGKESGGLDVFVLFQTRLTA